MDVRIVEFPETHVAVAEHRGPPELEHETSKKLIEWRIHNRLSPANHRTYGVHYTDPQSIAPTEHCVDFCVTYDQLVQPNPQGIISKSIPANRCAVARHLGPGSNTAVVYLHRDWLPNSGERQGNYPAFFHYVNVGPNIRDDEMVVDVYLPLA